MTSMPYGIRTLKRFISSCNAVDFLIYCCLLFAFWKSNTRHVSGPTARLVWEDSASDIGILYAHGMIGWLALVNATQDSFASLRSQHIMSKTGDYSLIGLDSVIHAASLTLLYHV